MIKRFLRRLQLKFVMKFLQKEMATFDNSYDEIMIDKYLYCYNTVLVDLNNKRILS